MLKTAYPWGARGKGVDDFPCRLLAELWKDKLCLHETFNSCLLSYADVSFGNYHIVIATATVFLLRYENTRENLGGVKQAVERQLQAFSQLFPPS